jgi:hypothetical protein
MIDTQRLLARLLGQTEPNEDVARAIAQQTFPTGSFGRAQLASPIGAPAPVEPHPQPAPVPSMAPPREIAEQPMPGTPYQPPPQPAAPAEPAAPAPRGPAPDFSPSFAQRMMNFGDALNGGGTDLNEQAKSRTKTFEMLRGWGLDDASAEFAARNPTVLQSLFTSKHGGAQTDDLKEYAIAQKQGYKGTFIDFKKATQRTNAVQWKDVGTELVGLDASGNEVSRIAKDVQGAAAAKAAGTAQGDAQAALPKALDAGQRMIDKIEQIESNPNLSSVTGWEGYFPTLKPENVDTEARIEQVLGSAFLQAFESLKGGGAITEVEGAKAEAAITRLRNLKQSDAGYKQALADAKTEVRALMELAKVKAQGGYASSTPSAPEAPSAPPAPGSFKVLGVR